MRNGRSFASRYDKAYFDASFGGGTFMGVGATNKIFCILQRNASALLYGLRYRINRTRQSITRIHESIIHVIFMLKLDWFNREKPAQPIMEAI